MRAVDADDDKRTRILDAALAAFSAYGVARTTMAELADGAGMSRPAVYQYFANKDEILRAVLERALSSAADRAIAELDSPGPLAGQLDRFLQRWYGDLTEQLAGTRHGAEVVEAKAGHAKPVADAVNARVRAAVVARLARALDAPKTRADVGELADLLLLSPMGLKYDAPSVTTLRRRLSALARTVGVAAGQAGDADQPVTATTRSTSTRSNG